MGQKRILTISAAIFLLTTGLLKTMEAAVKEGQTLLKRIASMSSEELYYIHGSGGSVSSEDTEQDVHLSKDDSTSLATKAGMSTTDKEDEASLWRICNFFDPFEYDKDENHETKLTQARVVVAALSELEIIFGKYRFTKKALIKMIIDKIMALGEKERIRLVCTILSMLKLYLSEFYPNIVLIEEEDPYTDYTQSFCWPKRNIINNYVIVLPNTHSFCVNSIEQHKCFSHMLGGKITVIRLITSSLPIPIPRTTHTSKYSF
jgi:hypothetical protein